MKYLWLCIFLVGLGIGTIGCQLLERTTNADGTVNPSVFDYAADVAMGAATAAGLVPPEVGGGVLGALGIGAAYLINKGRKQKNERIKLAQAAQEIKEKYPDEVREILIKHGVKDKKFYDKYIRKKP